MVAWSLRRHSWSQSPSASCPTCSLLHCSYSLPSLHLWQCSAASLDLPTFWELRPFFLVIFWVHLRDDRPWSLRSTFCAWSLPVSLFGPWRSSSRLRYWGRPSISFASSAPRPHTCSLGRRWVSGFPWRATSTTTWCSSGGRRPSSSNGIGACVSLLQVALGRCVRWWAGTRSCPYLTEFNWAGAPWAALGALPGCDPPARTLIFPAFSMWSSIQFWVLLRILTLLC